MIRRLHFSSPFTDTPASTPSTTSQAHSARPCGHHWVEVIGTCTILLVQQCLQICKEAGIVTPDGKLSSTYKSWGRGPTMTPTYEQLTGEGA